MLTYEAAEDYEQAFHWAKVHNSRAGKEEAVQKLAKQGYAEAQTVVHELQPQTADAYYHRGMQLVQKGAIKDKLLGLANIEAAAKLGHAEAQYYCGVRYQEGLFTAADEEKALSWYEKATQQGRIEALF